MLWHKRTLILLAIMLFAFLAGVLAPPTAQAALVGCRRDPLVLLSNGVQVQMTVSIETDIRNVQEIVYAVHAPSGVQVAGVRYLGDTKLRESLLFYDDAPAGTYRTQIIVHALDKSAAVAARTRVNSVSAIATGRVEQWLAVTLSSTLASPTISNRTYQFR